MKYYMTGATGFLSAYIIRDLVKDGHEVVVTDLAPHRNSWRTWSVTKAL